MVQEVAFAGSPCILPSFRAAYRGSLLPPPRRTRMRRGCVSPPAFPPSREGEGDLVRSPYGTGATTVGVGLRLATVDAGGGGRGRMVLAVASSVGCGARAGTWGSLVIAVAMPGADGAGTGCDSRC